LTRFQAAVDLTVLAARQVLTDVYHLEQRAERQAEALTLAVGRGPETLRLAPPALTERRLRLHLLLLDGIAAYAESLNRIATLPSQRRLPMALGATADRLLSLTDEFRVLAGTGETEPLVTEPESEADDATAGKRVLRRPQPETPFEAARRLGQFLILKHPLVEVPAVVRELHPSLRLIVEALAMDLGPRFPEAAGRGAGLRATLSETRVRMDTLRRKALTALAADARVNRAERYRTALDMAAVSTPFDRLDLALAALDDALRMLVAAHAKLVEPDSQAARWRTGLFYRAAAQAARSDSADLP